MFRARVKCSLILLILENEDLCKRMWSWGIQLSKCGRQMWWSILELILGHCYENRQCCNCYSDQCVLPAGDWGYDTLAIKLLTEFSVRHKNQYVRDFHFQKQLRAVLIWKAQHWIFCIMVKMKRWVLCVFICSLHRDLCQDYKIYFSKSHSAGDNITAINLI